MRTRARLRTGLLLVAASLVGCDAKTSPFFRPPDTSQGLVPAAIGGMVTLNGVGLPGVRVTLDPTTRFVESDSSGNYTFIPVATGPYSVQISHLPDDVYCPVTEKPVVVEPGALLQVDFMCVLAAGLSGVLDQDGTPLDSVPITIVGPSGGGGGGSPPDTVVVVSDSLGVYTLRNLPPGTYMVTPGPLPPGVVCVPPSQTVSVGQGEVLILNFLCTRLGHVVGVITVDGVPISGVLVTLSGSGNGTTVTDSLGRFVFTGVAGGDAFVDLAGLPSDVNCQPLRGVVTVEAAQVSTVEFVCVTNAPTPPQDDVYDVSYTLVSSTCGVPFLPPGAMTVVLSPPSALDLYVDHLTAPVSGPYDPATGSFTGDTPWLPYAGGFPFQTEAAEEWVLTFSLVGGARGDFTGRVFRRVRQTSTQNIVCRIEYSVAGTLP